MGLLLSCWFIIENILIPHGFAKWYCLSFFAHPLILIFCQIFLWIKAVGSWAYLILFQPFRLIFRFFSSWIFRFRKTYITFFFSLRKSNNYDIVLQQNDHIILRKDGSIANFNAIQSIVLYDNYIDIGKTLYESIGVLVEDKNMTDEFFISEELVVEENNEQVVNEELVVDNGDNNFTQELDIFHVDNDIDEDMENTLELTPSRLESASTVETQVETERKVEEMDPFYVKYVERMRWYDLLSHERTSGMSSILNNQFGTPSSLERIESVIDLISIPYMSKMDKRKLIRSLECDIEKVYVGQICLCWEALHYQYKKVEHLLLSSPQKGGAFCDNVAGNFQNFQVLLERFMENEVVDSRRFWNYVEARFSTKELLHVPKISGYFEEEKEGEKEEGVSVKEVLISIEKSIMAFWVFVQSDNKKSWWRFKSLMCNYPPIEDPKDLGHLADLTKELQKKEMNLKDLQRRKKRSWLKKIYHHHDNKNENDEFQNIEILFCNIELKLVSRVLKMSLISTPQLKWCQEKLKNLDFKEGRVLSINTPGCILFPP